MVNKTNYQFLKSIPKDIFLQYIRRGIIPAHFMDWLLIYEFFVKYNENHKNKASYVYCADKFNLHENTIRNIVKFMSYE